MATKERMEKDSMGEMTIPSGAYWGAQTQRAVENFPISGYRVTRPFIRALGLIKQSAAQVNCELDRLDDSVAALIDKAAQEVIEGQLDANFVVDIFQTGSGTSTNMNTNEVIANRAIEISGGTVGSKDPVHPNDHVNMGQSSNDVIPTAIHVAAVESLAGQLRPAVAHFGAVLRKKADAFDSIVKIGRTHLQDATPVRLGQEFSGFARQMEIAVERIDRAIHALRELPIGGTAVGTGINTHPEFDARMCAKLAAATGQKFEAAVDHFEAQAAKDAVCEAAGQLKTIAVSVTKIANDIRMLASGPRCGIGEILLPAVQPGSSIMPGKVNPVMSEMLIQVAAQVIGNDTAIAIGCRDGHYELNVMMPMMAHNLLESIQLLANGCRVFADRCVAGIEANRERCEELIEGSLAMCTSLAPIIGYDKAAAIAKEAYQSGKTVRQVAREHKVLSDDELDKALDPMSMTKPG